ncbi:site-specific integrase [Flavobacterium sp.]|uniref:site-specific integrase n=1 Tax=Flavobacterium sp. TaxID=239 RepID=UPI002602D3FF|nr:site-specific integrase [Flavobacterium sp.]
MEATITNLFYLKRAKANVDGLVPIYHRTTINGKRLDKSTGKYIDPTKWSTEAGRMKGNSEEARTINSHLDSLIAKNSSIEKKLIAVDKDITAEVFNNVLTGKTEKQRTLVPIFQNHNDQIEALVKTEEYSPGTLERYKTSLSHTKEFMKWKFNISDINIKDIDLAFITDYDFYLRTERGCSNNTTVKYIKNFKKIIQICLDNRWIIENPFVKYKGKIKEVDRDFLTESEIETIYNKKFHCERLIQVRDIFIFCCFTGLAYIDVKQLTSDHIGIGIDGNKWIFKNRQKTDTSSKIPLLPIPEQIMAKYASHPKCLNEETILPVLSNQKMNSYLKEIGDVCGIKTELTFHLARHSFATSITLTNGVPIESVSKMLGHTNIRTTQHYAKVVDRKVSDDMAILKQKLAPQLIAKSS